MKKIILALTFLLGFSTLAKAQTHPCDITNPPNSVSNPAKVGYCWDGKDLDGNATTATATKVYVGNSTTPIFSGLLNPIGNANAQGLRYYETPAITFPVATTSLRVVITNAGGDSAAAPFSMTITIPVPTSPILPRIVK